MAWELLPVNYTDAVWSVWAGLKRYNQINNEDGSVPSRTLRLIPGKRNLSSGQKTLTA